MSEISQDIQSLLTAPTGLDFQAANNQADYNSNVVQSQRAALANAKRQQQQADAMAKLGTTSLDKYLNSSLDDPNRPNYYNAALVLNPQLREGIAQGYKDLSDDAQKQHLQDSASILGYAQAGDWDNGIAHMDSIIAADQKAGKPTQEDEAYKALLVKAKGGDKAAANQALNTSQLQLSAVLGKDKFAELYPNLVKLPTDIQATQAKTANDTASANEATARTNTLIPAQANQANAAANKDNAAATGTFKDATNEDGSAILYNDKTGQQIEIGSRSSTDNTDIDQSTQAILDTEWSPTGPNTNPNSNATGPSQAIESTWIDQMKRNFPELAKGKTKAEVLALRNDPKVAFQVANNINKENVYGLRQAQQPINNTTAAMAYKLGLGGGGTGTSGAGAIEVLQADPTTPLSKILPANVIKANKQGGIPFSQLTAGDYTRSLAQQIPPKDINLGDPNATGDDYLATLPRGRANLVKSIVNGETPPPTGRNGVTALGTPLMQDVLKADPSFKATRYQSVQDLGDQSKPIGKSINGMNTMIQHIAQYAELARQRNAQSDVASNFIGNVASGVFGGAAGLGGGKTAGIVRQMKLLQKQIGLERSNILNVDDAKGQEALGADLDPSLPQSSLNKSINLILDASLAKMNSSMQQFQQTTGMEAPKDKFIFPDTQKVLTKTQQLINQNRDPNRGEISFLYQNPTDENKAHFDAEFGKGSANHYLSLGSH